jgi:hypothetical protein
MIASDKYSKPFYPKQASGFKKSVVKGFNVFVIPVKTGIQSI